MRPLITVLLGGCPGSPRLLLISPYWSRAWQGGFATGTKRGRKIPIFPWLQTFSRLMNEPGPFLPSLPAPSHIMLTKTVYVPVMQDTF